MKILSQRDEHWKDKKLGNSNLTIGNYGCVVTALAMMFDSTPDRVNDYLKKHGGFKGANVIWAKIPGFIKIGWTYNNAAVLAAIKKYGACMVRTDFDGNPRTDGDHYVVFIGKHRLADPWVGKERPTSAYTLLKGYIIFDIEKGKKAFMNTDTDPLQECLKQHTHLMELLTKKDKKLDEIRKQLGKCQKALEAPDLVRKNLMKANRELRAKDRENTKTLTNWQTKIKLLTTRVNKLAVKNQKLATEKQDYKRRYENDRKKVISNVAWWQLLLEFGKRIVKLTNFFSLDNGKR